MDRATEGPRAPPRFLAALLLFAGLEATLFHNGLYSSIIEPEAYPRLSAADFTYGSTKDLSS